MACGVKDLRASSLGFKEVFSWFRAELPQESDLEVVVAQQHEVANRYNLGCEMPYISQMPKSSNLLDSESQAVEPSQALTIPNLKLLNSLNH